MAMCHIEDIGHEMAMSISRHLLYLMTCTYYDVPIPDMAMPKVTPIVVGMIGKVDMVMHTPETRFFNLGIIEPYARHRVWRQPRRTIVSKGKFVKLGIVAVLCGSTGIAMAQQVTAYDLPGMINQRTMKSNRAIQRSHYSDDFTTNTNAKTMMTTGLMYLQGNNPYSLHQSLPMVEPAMNVLQAAGAPNLDKISAPPPHTQAQCLDAVAFATDPGNWQKLNALSAELNHGGKDVGSGFPIARNYMTAACARYFDAQDPNIARKGPLP